MTQTSNLPGDPRPARERLASIQGIRPGVSIIDNPAPRDPDCRAAIIAGIRFYEVRRHPHGYVSAFHIGMNEWLPLLAGGSEESAFDAVAQHVERVGRLPPSYAPATDAAEREAARIIHAQR